MIYEISKQIRELEDALASGDIDQEVYAHSIESMEGDIEALCEHLADINTNDTALADALNTEAERLESRAKSLKVRCNDRKMSILNLLNRAGKTKLTTSKYTFTVVKGRESTVITNEEELPAEFVLTKVTTQPDKTAIKSAIKSGQNVSGAEIAVGPKTLRVK